MELQYIIQETILAISTVEFWYGWNRKVQNVYTDWTVFSFIFSCRSTEDEFNPRAAQQKYLSHSLIDLLSQVNDLPSLVSVKCLYSYVIYKIRCILV